MKIWILYIIISCYYVDKCKSDLGFGRCGAVKSMSPFNVSGILGRWYVYEVNEIISATIQRCASIDIEKESNNKNMTVLHLYISRLILDTNFNLSTECTATEIGRTSKFYQVGLFFVASSLYIIDSDYNNYMIMYVCAEVFGLVHDRNIIIATREGHPSNVTINEVEKIIINKHLGYPNNFFQINDNNCATS